jgi:hypothetical protein
MKPGLVMVLGVAWVLQAGCGSDSTGPAKGVVAAGSAYRGGAYFADLRYLNDACRSRSVTATGPGAGGPVTVDLACTSSGEWLATVFLGPTHPVPPATYSYVFTIDDGKKTFELTGSIPCWLESVPTALAPSGTVTSPVTFQWATLPAAQGMEYTANVTALVSGDVTRLSVIDQGSTSAPLASGPYSWYVDAIAVGGHSPGSTKNCSARAAGQAFTVQ